jgi:hypothetical protein
MKIEQHNEKIALLTGLNTEFAAKYSDYLYRRPWRLYRGKGDSSYCVAINYSNYDPGLFEVGTKIIVGKQEYFFVGATLLTNDNHELNLIYVDEDFTIARRCQFNKAKPFPQRIAIPPEKVVWALKLVNLENQKIANEGDGVKREVRAKKPKEKPKGGTFEKLEKKTKSRKKAIAKAPTKSQKSPILKERIPKEPEEESSSSELGETSLCDIPDAANPKRKNPFEEIQELTSARLAMEEERHSYEEREFKRNQSDSRIAKIFDDGDKLLCESFKYSKK